MATLALPNIARAQGLYVPVEECARLKGGSVTDCVCMLLPHDPEKGGGFLDCPPAARGQIIFIEGCRAKAGDSATAHEQTGAAGVDPAGRLPTRRSVGATEVAGRDSRERPAPFSRRLADREGIAPAFSGDPCPECGQFQMVRTGSCQTCQACGFNGSCG